MVSMSQRMLELTDSQNGISTREIVEILWPDTFGVACATARPALIEKLKHLRQASNLPEQLILNKLEWKESKLIRVEGGNISSSDLRKLLLVYGVFDENIVQDLLELAVRARRLQYVLAKARNVLVV